MISALILFVVLVLASPATNAQRGTPPSQGAFTVIDYASAPETLENLFQASAAVIRGRVSSSGAPKAQGNPKFPRVVRRHEIHIIESFKTDKPLPPEIPVYQAGGTLLIDGRQVSTAYESTLLQPGDEVILFLLADKIEDAYWIAFGPVGVVSIPKNENSPKLSVHIASMREFKTSKQPTVDEFVGRLRALGKGK